MTDKEIRDRTISTILEYSLPHFSAKQSIQSLIRLPCVPSRHVIHRVDKGFEFLTRGPALLLMFFLSFPPPFQDLRWRVPPVSGLFRVCYQHVENARGPFPPEAVESLVTPFLFLVRCQILIISLSLLPLCLLFPV